MNTESYDKTFAIVATSLVVGGLLGYALGTGKFGGPPPACSTPEVAKIIESETPVK